MDKTKKSRPLHWAANFADTACGKDVMRVRVTRVDATWDNPRIADGRRCAACKAWLESERGAE